jgi:hypothetical protein
VHFRILLACLPAGRIWQEELAALTQAPGPVRKEIRAGLMGENAARFYRLVTS